MKKFICKLVMKEKFSCCFAPCFFFLLYWLCSSYLHCNVPLLSQTMIDITARRNWRKRKFNITRKNVLKCLSFSLNFFRVSSALYYSNLQFFIYASRHIRGRIVGRFIESYLSYLINSFWNYFHLELNSQNGCPLIMFYMSLLDCASTT